LTEIERASKKGCVLISGQEDVLRSRAVSGILSSLQLLPDDFDVQTFDAQTSQPHEWIGSAGTVPFLGERRVVIVRHLLQCEPPKDSKSLFSGLPGSALIVLVADPVGGSDDKRGKAKSFGTTWQKIVTASDGAVLSYEPDPKRSRDEVKAEALARGASISERALDTLVEMTGGSLSRSIEEFEKLVLFVGSSVTISERHVEAIVVPSREWNVFKLTDAIFEGTPAEALRQLRSMIGGPTHVEGAAFSQILPQVSRMIKLVWQSRVAIELGCSPAQPSAEFIASLPAKPNLLQISAYQRTKIMGFAKVTSFPALEKALRILADTDAKLKGGLPNFSSIDSLEMMVFDLIGAMR
jgi:DNA polymerase-3 subunit delta